MKAIEIKFKVKNSKNEWTETHIHKVNKNCNDPQQILKGILNEFNKYEKVNKRELVEIISTNEIDLFVCSNCGRETTDSDLFETDLGLNDDDDMTCEVCYNDMDEEY